MSVDEKREPDEPIGHYRNARQLARAAREAERALALWRDANGLDTERKFLEALPVLFHPIDIRRGERKRRHPDPLWQWETFPGDPTWLDSPTVQAALAKLWHLARLGKDWPLPILERFAAAWTFGDRTSQRAIAAARARVDKALLDDRDSLARYLRAVWKEIQHERPTVPSIRKALETAVAEDRVHGWALGHVPLTGGRRFAGGCDVDVVELLWQVVSSSGMRGPKPWVTIASGALWDFYGKRVDAPALPVDRTRQRRKKLSERSARSAPRV